MGLTKNSTGLAVSEAEVTALKRKQAEAVIALAGNPNVGKSTVFNALTGMNQHTGNWPGKTVTVAQGRCKAGDREYALVDTPGSYSLMAHSAEEETARDLICFGGADAVVVVCDASALERSLNLALQTLEVTPRVVLCVNLMDEARARGFSLRLSLLQKRLGVPVVPTSARSGDGLEQLMAAASRVSRGRVPEAFAPEYPAPIEEALTLLTPVVRDVVPAGGPAPRWLALRLLEGDQPLLDAVNRSLGFPLSEAPYISQTLADARKKLSESGFDTAALRDAIVQSIIHTEQTLCVDVVRCTPTKRQQRDSRLDRIVTGRRAGIPLMLLLLMLIFWLTITGANAPSRFLSNMLFRVGDVLRAFLTRMRMPAWLLGVLVDGAYRVLAWVVSVMLPPMAIFFPLFTLLEDSGYLPRVAFDLDHCFQKCRACGKQALTMAMGFGCNAAGVVGCRIIDSPRERLIAILTNSFVPCNGRFPTLIALLTMFFAGTSGGWTSSLLSAVFLTGIVLLGVAMTFLSSRFLSCTVLRGMPSSFTLELPPYRRPQIGKVLVRSIFDRTLFVLGRAAAVAAPAGMIIWCMANFTWNGQTLLALCSNFLDPFARFFGLDGVILLAFILGFPANEIVVPIILMGYLASGGLVEMNELSVVHTLLAQNGWTWVTALCTMLFSMMHWPCSTTCLTIYRETKSLKWTAAAVFLPAAAGLLLCALVANAARLIGV